MSHIIGFIQNIFLEDAPNFLRNVIHSFLSEHITIITGTDGTHGYLIYVNTTEYKWKYLAAAVILGQTVNNKANNTNTLCL